MSAENTARSVHQRLLNIRDKTGEQFNHPMMRYGLERLLYRIQAAGHADTFVLKGAMLFALWHDVPGRPTRDIDLLSFGDLSHDRLRAIFAEACTDAILNHMDIDDELLRKAIRATFERRSVPLPRVLPAAFTADFLEDGIKETQWREFLRRSSLTSFGLDLATVLADLKERLWPMLSAPARLNPLPKRGRR